MTARNLQELVDFSVNDPAAAYQGGIADEMLRRVQAEKDVPEPLRTLLRAHDTRLQEIGTYVVGELGSYGEAFLADVLPLVHSPVPRVRFQALESVAVCCKDGRVVSLFDSILDPHGAVRRFLWEICVRLPALSYREAKVAYLENGTTGALVAGLDLVLDANPQKSEAALLSDDPVIRGFGVISLCRNSDDAVLQRAIDRVEASSTEGQVLRRELDRRTRTRRTTR